MSSELSTEIFQRSLRLYWERRLLFLEQSARSETRNGGCYTSGTNTTNSNFAISHVYRSFELKLITPRLVRYSPAKVISEKPRDGLRVGLGNEAVRRHEVGHNAFLPALHLMEATREAGQVQLFSIWCLIGDTR